MTHHTSTLKYLILSFTCILTPLVFAEDSSQPTPEPKPTPAPATTPAPSATTDAKTPVDEKSLDRFEELCRSWSQLSSRVRLSNIDTFTGDEQVRYGNLSFKARIPATPKTPEVPNRIRVDFTGLVQDDKQTKIDEQYIFDGWKLLELRREKDQSQTGTRRTIRLPNNPQDALDLGTGKLPIPMTFEKKSALLRFDIYQENADKHPAKPQDLGEMSLCVWHLIPKDKKTTKVDAVYLFLQSDSLMPVAAVTREGAQKTEVLLSKIDTKTEVPDTLFSTATPEGAKVTESKNSPSNVSQPQPAPQPQGE